jgi:hypothetical protein
MADGVFCAGERTHRGIHMKHLITAICCASAIGVAGLSAAQAAQTDRDKADKDTKSTIVTGCISNKDGQIMLTEELLTGDMKHDLKGDMKPASYNLVGNNLTAHVGHKVEVTGTTDAKTTSKDTSKNKMDTTKMSTPDVHGTINVLAVKMISTSCP